MTVTSATTATTNTELVNTQVITSSSTIIASTAHNSPTTGLLKHTSQKLKNDHYY